MRTLIKFKSGKSKYGYYEVVDGKKEQMTEDEGLALIASDPDNIESEDYDYKPLARAERHIEINDLMKAAYNKDIVFNGEVFDCTAVSRANISAKANANARRTARNISFTTNWIAKDDSTVTMTPDELEDLGFTMELQYETALFIANVHKKALAAKQLVSTIESYNINTGW